MDSQTQRFAPFVALGLLMFLLQFNGAYAMPDFPDRIPNGRNVKDQNGNSWLGVGHLRSGGSGALNAFGDDFLAAGFQWTRELCQKDSDGDGLSNGQELGDPRCVWTVGSVPEFPAVSHPGFAGDAPPGAIDTCKNFTEPAHATNMTIQFNPPFTLPDATVTSYPRQAFNLSAVPGSGGNTDHWAFRFEVIYGGPTEVVHHILLYSCTAAEVASYLAGPILTGGMPCSGGLVFGWAIAYCTPNGIALRLKASKPFVLMEVHMNNAAEASGVQSAPGFRITALPLNQPQPPVAPKQANWLWLGANLESISIPPGQPYVELTSTVTLPTTPSFTAKLIASLSHMHYLGKKVWVENIPASPTVTSKPSLSCNPKYNNEDQEVIPINEELTVSNGDKLVVHCVFDSTNRTNVTIGGEQTTDEMCFVFFLYVSDQIPSPSAFSIWNNGVITTRPQETSVSCEAAGVAETGLDGSLLPPWMIAHAILGAIGFGFLMPLGTLLPASKAMRALPNAKWFKGHKALVGVGCLAGWTAFSIGIAFVTIKLSTSHGKLGLSITVLAICQVLLGLFRPHLPKEGGVKSAGRYIWEYVHPFLGRTIVICCAAQMYLGYSLLNLFLISPVITIWAWVHTVGIFGLWLFFLLGFKISAARSPGGNGKTMDADAGALTAKV